ncbi:MAG: hypothetical protein ABIN44_07310 [Burkholderiaceae bacterium]
MSIAADAILAELHKVEAERARRRATTGLESKVQAIKRYQQKRFAHTYADLLASPRYAAASHFFLEELYGPGDFSRRDAQFARVVPTLDRIFPQELVDTVATLASLHALSESLDSNMGEHLMQLEVTGPAYVRAWQATARADDRERQIALTLEVASSLDRLTRKPLIRNSLRLMRGAARATGLGDLQRFLESGFETFRAMRGAKEFMSIVDERERSLCRTLFAAKWGPHDAQARNEVLP